MTALGGWRSKRTGRVVVGIVGFMVAVGYTLEARAMPMGTAEAPGPGAFPWIVGLVACVISLIVVAEAIWGDVVQGDVDLPSGRNARLVLGFAGATVAYVVALPFLGQYVAAVLYMTGLLKLLGPHRWPRTIAYGVVSGVAVSWIFIGLLGIRMPTGALWALVS